MNEIIHTEEPAYLCGISRTLQRNLGLFDVLLSEGVNDALAHIDDRKAASVPD